LSRSARAMSSEESSAGAEIVVAKRELAEWLMVAGCWLLV